MSYPSKSLVIILDRALPQRRLILKDDHQIQVTIRLHTAHDILIGSVGNAIEDKLIPSQFIVPLGFISLSGEITAYLLPVELNPCKKRIRFGICVVRTLGQ